ncbi:hypothetical protein Pcinc_004257 [Petrolisthes cinctipes]|uniref:THAP-type domain-containing protein n=1 Tax=Petrolisthes cinctipes TaxID=88211 RepID=A0AAE1GFL8_PETCI|nr:hypothetical protein Pcinc_004257 [Petrolisthes cinctipes]
MTSSVVATGSGLAAITGCPSPQPASLLAYARGVSLERKMPQCAAWKCRNRSDHCKRDGKSFHKFPKDPKTRRAWIHSLRLENFTPSAHTVVCGDHFEDICLDRTGQTTRLREGSIPSIFDFPAHLRKKIKPRKPPPQRSCPASTSVIDALQPDADKEYEVTITTKEPTCNLAINKGT